jgi:Na+-transporting NADH:ubiquinone oxidoreductase subunit F
MTMAELNKKLTTNYRQCRIDINGKKELAVDGGKSLLSTLVDEKIFLPSACGGRGICGLCKIRVLEGAGGVENVLPTETPFLTEDEINNNVRLGCQVKVCNDLKIEIPEELFNIKKYACQCVEIIDLTYDTKKFRLKLKEPEAIDFIAGQYIQLLCPEYKGSNEEVFRAYSISSNPAEKTFIELIIRRVPKGICTTFCFDFLKVGDTVKINGPYGKFRLSNSNAPMIFIAGASGMAPFISILNQMKNADIKRNTTYFFGGNEEKDMFFANLMGQFEIDLAGFKYVPVVARPSGNWQGQKGLVTEAVQKSFKSLSGHEGYLCGSPGMIDASIKVLSNLGMKEESIFYDKF